ncbi:MAG: molybdate ABC transporter substrate-binding protein [Anaerovoracaceae bacterium]
MKKRVFTIVVAMVLVIALGLGLAGCGNKDEEKKATATTDLKGKTLHIFCGAGMTEPFQKISDAFEEKTGCKMEITFANAGQIQTQINKAKEGDLFIAGSTEELKPVEKHVSESTPLVKHIPVLAVQKGNPKEIKGLKDLTKDGVRVVLADAESTPIGKIANKALSDAGIMKKVNVVARTTTAPQVFAALEAKEADAVIVWKENIKDQGEVVDTEDMTKYIKEIPAASLSFSKEDEARKAFLEFLATEAGTKIWEKFGYEIVK